MKVESDLEAQLGLILPHKLAEGIAADYMAMRRSRITHAPGSASPGRFVEGFVQALQYMANGTYDQKPSVDRYLREVESSEPKLPEGLRICGARIGRSMYSLRSKRNIVHRNALDPSSFDLDFLLKAASWLLSELLRATVGADMDAMAVLIERIQAPLSPLIEDRGDRRLVLEQVSVRNEILILLDSYYPEAVLRSVLFAALDRRNEATVRRRLAELWKERLIDGDADTGYALTTRGVEAATVVVTYSLERNLLGIRS